MTIIAGLLIAALIFQAVSHRRQLETQARFAEKERRSLLERIQHPELRQLDIPEGYEPPEIPADAAELAFVGQEVPEFIHVGTKEP